MLQTIAPFFVFVWILSQLIRIHSLLSVIAPPCVWFGWIFFLFLTKLNLCWTCFFFARVCFLSFFPPHSSGNSSSFHCHYFPSFPFYQMKTNNMFYGERNKQVDSFHLQMSACWMKVYVMLFIYYVTLLLLQFVLFFSVRFHFYRWCIGSVAVVIVCKRIIEALHLLFCLQQLIEFKWIDAYNRMNWTFSTSWTNVPETLIVTHRQFQWISLEF